MSISRIAHAVRHRKVVRGVRRICDVNRCIARHVVQRVHSVVPSQRRIVGRNLNRISVYIGNGEVHRLARLDRRRTRHQTLGAIDSRHVVRDSVLVHMGLITQHDGLVLTEKRGDAAICFCRIIRMRALIGGARARKLDCVIVNVSAHEIVRGTIGTGQLRLDVIRNGSAFKALRNIVDIIRVYRLLILIDERNMHIVGAPLHRTNRHRLGDSGLPRGVIGSRLVRGGNLRGLDGDRQAVVHDLGGNRVRAGLVGGHIGVRTVDGVEHAARLEAVVGSHRELDLGLGREIDRILVLGDRLLGAVRVGVLERRVRDLDRYLRGGILLDRGGVILGRTPPREVILVAFGPSGLVGLLVVRGLRVGRGVRGGVRGRIRRIIPLVHRGVGPLGGGPLRGGRLVLGVHRAVLDDLLLSVGRDAELLSDRRDVHGGDGHRCDEHAHQRTLGTHAMLFREVPAFFPKVLP